jgi:ACS family allantoate permease-like MFS transporter
LAGPTPAADVDIGSVEKHPHNKMLQHSHDADEALKAFSGLEGESIEVDEATNKRLLRIIDRHMMPLMCLVYGMNYLDSTNQLRHGLDQG